MGNRDYFLTPSIIGSFICLSRMGNQYSSPTPSAIGSFTLLNLDWESNNLPNPSVIGSSLLLRFLVNRDNFHASKVLGDFNLEFRMGIGLIFPTPKVIGSFIRLSLDWESIRLPYPKSDRQFHSRSLYCYTAQIDPTLG